MISSLEALESSQIELSSGARLDIVSACGVGHEREVLFLKRDFS